MRKSALFAMFRTLPLISRLFLKVLLHELQTIASLLHEYLSMVGSAAYMGIVFYELCSLHGNCLLWTLQLTWELSFMNSAAYMGIVFYKLCSLHGNCLLWTLQLTRKLSFMNSAAYMGIVFYELCGLHGNCLLWTMEFQTASNTTLTSSINKIKLIIYRIERKQRTCLNRFKWGTQTKMFLKW